MTYIVFFNLCKVKCGCNIMCVCVGWSTTCVMILRFYAVFIFEPKWQPLNDNRNKSCHHVISNWRKAQPNHSHVIKCTTTFKAFFFLFYVKLVVILSRESFIFWYKKVSVIFPEFERKILFGWPGNKNINKK